MNRFEIIKVSDPEWTRIISLTCQYDFYHTQSYSLLVRNGEPVLCVAFSDNDFIAIPLIIRQIEGTDLFDCTSVYGYCGPVSNLPAKNLATDHIGYFQTELLKFFKERQIISAFSRLHPVIDQGLYFNGFGFIREINKTVAIDLRLPERDQVKKYRKSTRSEINQLRRKGYVITETTTPADIEAFAKVYNDCMTKKNADPYLFFDNEYFFRFLGNPSFETKLLLALNGNVITAGAIFTLTNKIMQYHLACSKKEFLKDASMKLILDQARLIGIENNMDVLHLGGGLNGSSEDSLFKFKSGFSDTRFIYKTWQLIVDEEKYSFLINFFNIDIEKKINFFPVYRAV